MTNLSRLLWLALAGFAIAMPVIGARIDLSIKGERDATMLKFVQESYGNCAEVEKDSFGRCPSTHRSLLRSRILRGGGPGSGK